MTFKNISELPSSLKKLPVKAQQLFVNVSNDSSFKNGETLAFKIAWAAVKKRFTKTGDKWVAKGMGLDFYTFTMVSKPDIFIQKADNGEYYLEATLSDTEEDSEGKRFTASALQTYADQINKYGVAGFITHQDWDAFKMANSHLSEEEFVNKARKERKGILKTVSAVFKKGKLWIKALIDKRYLNHIRRFNKVSIEALVPSRLQTRSEYKGGYVLGFALDNQAINQRATIDHIS